MKRGIGSYGDGQFCLRNPLDFPSDIFRRKTIGTDIFIVGYMNSKDWAKDLILSILRNFWYAIFKGELSISIQANVIDSTNIEEYLTNNFSGELYRDDIRPIGNPLQYYLAVNKGKCFQEKLKHLGNVSYYFLDTDEYLNHVAMMRGSHMVIFSRAFRFPGNFAGVFICDDPEGNRELRKMEPPAHNEWDIKRNIENGKKFLMN